MSQHNSQSTLGAPVEIVPSTPIRRATLSPSPDLSAKRTSSQSEKRIFSPPPLSSSEMTPPPSTQIPGAPLRSRSHSRSTSPTLVTQAELDKSLCDAYGASENLPTAEQIESASETELRIIAKDLLTVARESRMSALHFKLQNSLVSFASNEAVKRAEVEQHLAKREVEIIQSEAYRTRSRPADLVTPKQSTSPSNSDYLSAIQRSQELEEQNKLLDRRLRNAKRAIDDATSRSYDLEEQNNMLKQRIGDNRKHFTQIFSYGTMSPATQHEIHNMGHGEHTDGLAALLYADKLTNHTNAYGATSATSVPMTPNQPKNEYSTPSGNPVDDHYDSDSTVSLSTSEAPEHSMPSPQQMRSTAPKSSTLLQSKLFGHVQKPNVERSRPNKRKADSEDTGNAKKTRTGHGIGLGINA
ncbi:unnamed protein product [Penicillium salamii]|uniref:Uncharacterized protein n=1 Tax=Penicillium salamii TaxID=1612424 RepID=A0A9W4K2M2_9EURO|nr:unnamed protein product [Penicillium salamii]